MEGTQTVNEHTFELDLDLGSLPVFCAEPATDKRLPALILVHEIFGVNDHIRDLARKFAQHQMRVYAPDLFKRSSLFPAIETERENLDTMRQAWLDIPDSQIMADMEVLFSHLQEQKNINGKIGTMGFCMGGAISLLFGCHQPKLSFVVDFYGRIRYGLDSKNKPKDPIDYLVPLKAPLLALFAGKDQLITKHHVEEFSRRLQELNKSYQLKVYDEADHAFFNDQRPHFDRDASADAWQLVLAFIKKHSKEETVGAT